MHDIQKPTCLVRSDGLPYNSRRCRCLDSCRSLRSSPSCSRPPECSCRRGPGAQSAARRGIPFRTLPARRSCVACSAEYSGPDYTAENVFCVSSVAPSSNERYLLANWKIIIQVYWNNLNLSLHGPLMVIRSRRVKSDWCSNSTGNGKTDDGLSLDELLGNANSSDGLSLTTSVCGNWVIPEGW